MVSESDFVPEEMTDDQKKYLVEVSGLREESASVRQLFEDTWHRNDRRYLGQHWDKSAKEGRQQFTLNRTQNAIIAIAAIQTEQRPQILVEPRETNEPPIYFLKPDAAEKLEDAPNVLTPQQAQGVEPIEQAVVQQLLTVPMEVDGEPVEGMEGQMEPTRKLIPLFDEEDFYAVDDQAVAEAVQKAEEIFWDKSNSDFLWAENILNKGIIGHQSMLRQWDNDKSCPEGFNLHPFNVWIDPVSNGDIEDAEYLIYDQVMSVSQAKALMPERSKLIDAHKSQASFESSSAITSSGNALGNTYHDTTFHRDMIVLTTVWKRNEMWPKTPDEAIRDNDVRQAMQAVPVTDQIGQPIVDDLGEPVTQDEPIEGTYQFPDGSLIAEDDPQWPQKTVIRQTQILGQTIIDDRECPYRDIPVAWNPNIPIPFRPYGQGDPERVEDLQQAINRVLSNLHDHLRYFAAPQQVMLASVMKDLKSQGRSIHAHPGKTVGIDDDTATLFGGDISKLVQTIDPPSLQRTYVDFLQLLLNEHDRIMGTSDVIQGFTNPDAESGRAIEALQAAARGPVGFKSQFTERAIKHMVKIDIGMMIDFLTEKQWVKMFDGIPVPVLLALKQRAKNIDYDITVKIVSGRADSKDVERRNALEEFQIGLSTPRETLKRIEQPGAERIAAELEAQAAMAAEAQQV